jgi:hypothetical protein
MSLELVAESFEKWATVVDKVSPICCFHASDYYIILLRIPIPVLRPRCSTVCPPYAIDILSSNEQTEFKYNHQPIKLFVTTRSSRVVDKHWYKLLLFTSRGNINSLSKIGTTTLSSMKPNRLCITPCALCQCDDLDDSQWGLPKCRLLFGRGESFHISTAPVYQHRPWFSRPNHGTPELYVTVDRDQYESFTSEGQQVFIVHEECFQYLQTVLHLRNCSYGPLLYEMIWLLAVSTSPAWSKNDNANESRAQLSVEDSMLDRGSLSLQSSIAVLRDPDLALTLTKISQLTDELILKISRHLPLSERTSHHGHYARLAIVFSQAAFALSYIFRQIYNQTTRFDMRRQPSEIDFSESGDVHYSTLRFGGRDYFTRLDTSPFPRSSVLTRAEIWDHIVYSTDMIGITGVRLVHISEYLRKWKPPKYDGINRWYHVAETSRATYRIEMKVSIGL